MGAVVWMKIAVISVCLASLARCEPPLLSNQYGAPSNQYGAPPSNQYGAPPSNQYGAPPSNQYGAPPSNSYGAPPSNQYGPPSTSYGTPTSGGYSGQGLTNSYGAPLGGDSGHGGGHGGHDEHQDYIDSQPKSYEFGYAVKDAASGNDFGRKEQSDGETVRGEYRVQLPDGRTQIVTYTADWRTGFHADVRYEGVAQYPDQYNNGNQGGYNSNAGYDYPAGNSLDSGYQGSHGGNHGGGGGSGYNNYQGGGGGSNGGGYNNNNYQYGSNSIDGGNFGQSLAPPPQQSYGVPFHRR